MVFVKPYQCKKLPDGLNLTPGWGFKSWLNRQEGTLKRVITLRAYKHTHTHTHSKEWVSCKDLRSPVIPIHRRSAHGRYDGFEYLILPWKCISKANCYTIAVLTHRYEMCLCFVVATHRPCPLNTHYITEPFRTRRHSAQSALGYEIRI